MPCRALEAFRLVERLREAGVLQAASLNALSGIGGVQTQVTGKYGPQVELTFVLMPCRALEAFRPNGASGGGAGRGR